MEDCKCGNQCPICEGCNLPECECVCDLGWDDEFEDELEEGDF